MTHDAAFNPLNVEQSNSPAVEDAHAQSEECSPSLICDCNVELLIRLALVSMASRAIR